MPPRKKTDVDVPGQMSITQTQTTPPVTAPPLLPTTAPRAGLAGLNLDAIRNSLKGLPGPKDAQPAGTPATNGTASTAAAEISVKAEVAMLRSELASLKDSMTLVQQTIGGFGSNLTVFMAGFDGLKSEFMSAVAEHGQQSRAVILERIDKIANQLEAKIHEVFMLLKNGRTGTVSIGQPGRIDPTSLFDAAPPAPDQPAAPETRPPTELPAPEKKKPGRPRKKTETPEPQVTPSGGAGAPEPSVEVPPEQFAEVVTQLTDGLVTIAVLMEGAEVTVDQTLLILKEQGVLDGDLPGEIRRGICQALKERPEIVFDVANESIRLKT